MSLRHLLAASLLVFILMSVHASVARASQNSSKDEEAVRQIVRQLQDGWNAHDGRAFAAPFTADADYVVVNGLRLTGREAIERGHTAIFTTIYKESNNVATVKSIRFLRPDIALVHVEWNLEYRQGGETKKARAMNSLVIMKEGGKWSITAFHNTPIQQEATQ